MTVTVYTLPDCAQCTATMRYMDRHGIPYTAKALRDDPAALAWATELGYTQAPVVLVEGLGARPKARMSWSGFVPANIKGLLKYERTD